jgi:hypothetical protein
MIKFIELMIKFIEITVMLIKSLSDKGRESLLRRGGF